MVPEKLSQYLKEHFGNSFTSGIKKIKDKNGKYIYLADISHEDVLHHLKFNEHGGIISKQHEPYHEHFDDEVEWSDND